MGHLLLLPLAAVAGPHSYPLPDPITAEDFHPFDPAKAKLGQLLFFDKILSGNRNIACATCHHPEHAGSDGLSLGIGEGGVGLGPERTAGSGPDRIAKRIPRNAPSLWNLGHRDIRVMFHDGRLESSNLYGNAYNSPAQEWLPPGLDTLIAAQAVFPLVAQFEMAGNPKENEIAGAVHDRIDAAWPILAKRVRILPAYGAGFVAAFDTIDRPAQVTIVEVAEAIGDYINADWRSFDSPFDAYLAGDPDALSAQARAGLNLFYGKAGCARCHSGPLLTDQDFHAIGLPPFGPGRTRPFDPHARDVGRMGESDRLEDAYRFRTPSLRNVALTGPWGHNGAYPTLRGIVEHHLDPDAALARWQPEMAGLPDAPWLSAVDFIVWQDKAELARQAARRDLAPVDLTVAEVDALLAFLHALTGATAGQHPLGRPDAVPSGLPMD
ncbi:cytochrome c peroxidase [Fluviibacterium sp. DFM31]|uniref:Cytochrome c peroxidase n=1 Tax=Meridianimarinicoccus marinus TaxID=3231483 RepID=A0ABV3L8C4_9RHOB